VLALAVSISSAGCMIPSYHLPAGFSSSYHRQIYGMDPAPPDPHTLGLAGIETHGGIFYPTTAFRESGSASEHAATQKAIEPLLLDSDPLTTKKVAQRSSADDI
jgi:hypothetical protein